MAGQWLSCQVSPVDRTDIARRADARHRNILFMAEHPDPLRPQGARARKADLAMAEELEIDNASTMRKGDMMFSILKERAEDGWEIAGDGVLEVMQDGFGFLRSPEANYLPGPDDIYVSPDMIRQHALRTGDTVDGVIQAPRENERYFGMTKVTQINFEEPEKARHKINFDNLTPLYPDERLKMEIDDPTIKDRSARIIDLVAPIGKGPAEPDRCAAADRQDGAVAEHRPFDRAEPSGMLPDRSADRRAAGRSDGYAAQREGRGDFLDLRRTGLPARGGQRNGDRKGQAAWWSTNEML